jgi:hypothetical protein
MAWTCACLVGGAETHVAKNRLPATNTANRIVVRVTILLPSFPTARKYRQLAPRATFREKKTEN